MCDDIQNECSGFSNVFWFVRELSFLEKMNERKCSVILVWWCSIWRKSVVRKVHFLCPFFFVSWAETARGEEDWVPVEQHSSQREDDQGIDRNQTECVIATTIVGAEASVSAILVTAGTMPGHCWWVGFLYSLLPWFFFTIRTTLLTAYTTATILPWLNESVCKGSLFGLSFFLLDSLVSAVCPHGTCVGRTH